MDKFNSLIARFFGLCKTFGFEVFVFIVAVLQAIGTTSVLFLAKTVAGYLFGVVNIVATLLLVCLYLAIYLRKDE